MQTFSTVAETCSFVFITFEQVGHQRSINHSSSVMPAEDALD